MKSTRERSSRAITIMTLLRFDWKRKSNGAKMAIKRKDCRFAKRNHTCLLVLGLQLLQIVSYSYMSHLNIHYYTYKTKKHSYNVPQR